MHYPSTSFEIMQREIAERFSTMYLGSQGGGRIVNTENKIVELVNPCLKT